MAVYLLHLNSPLSSKHTTQHYIGFANDVDARIKHHHNGTSGVRMMRVAYERGIGFVVARVWEDGTKQFERELKDRYKNATRLCPICQKQKLQKKNLSD